MSRPAESSSTGMAAVARFSGFVWKLVAYSQGGERLLADVPVDRVGDGGRRSAGGGCRLPNRQGRRSTIRSCLEHEGGVACPVNQLLYMTLRPRRTMRRGVALCSGVLAFVLLTAEASSCGSTPSATSSSAASTTPGSSPTVSSAPSPLPPPPQQLRLLHGSIERLQRRAQ